MNAARLRIRLTALARAAMALEPAAVVLVALWCTLACCAVSAWSPLRSSTGERLHYLTLLGPLMPSEWLTNEQFSDTIGIIFLIAGALWAARRWLPWTAWCTTLSFWLLSSIYQERLTYTDHTFNPECVFLFVFCAWEQFYRNEVRLATQTRRLWTLPTCPVWVSWLCTFYLAAIHTTAGLTKLVKSGLAWADGTSVQLWVWMWGNHDGLLARLILADRQLALVLQATTLLAETFAWLALLGLRLRIAIGALLLAFHLGSQAVFRLNFFALIGGLFLFFIVRPALTVRRSSRVLPVSEPIAP